MFMNGDKMVTKTKRVAAAPAKASEPNPSKRLRAPARAATESPTTSPEPAKQNILRAGLKALGNVGSDVVQHQSRVFEAILGIDPAQGWSGLIKRDSAAGKAAQEALGLRKFEAVFDQRVANALERLGMPAIERLVALERELATLREEVAALKSGAPESGRGAKAVRRKR
jgi:Poly(hydroxyalcanoate) granule associated protein (phasin)